MDINQIVYNMVFITVGVTIGSYIGSEIAYRNMVRKIKKEVKKIIYGHKPDENSLLYLLTQLAKKYNVRKEVVNILKEVLE